MRQKESFSSKFDILFIKFKLVEVLSYLGFVFPPLLLFDVVRALPSQGSPIPHGLKRARMVDADCCSKCCCIFSASGIVFLVLIGILLKTEPLYIQDVDDPSEAASNCFMAAGIYALFVVGTSMCILKKDTRRRDLSVMEHGTEAIGITKERSGGSYGR